MTLDPLLVTDRESLAAALADRPGRRAVVMTMGALHAGHLSLVERARELAELVVVTIFVNPLQFGPEEDLERYPRDLEGDLERLASVGADVVFAPTPDVVYPGGDPVVRVSAGRIGEVLEGASRPGHLDGVLTVVLKLMHLTQPDLALYGRKDAQQLAAIQRMVRDLDVPVEVVGVETVRDADGLALSSRNAYLSPEERERALVLSRALAAGQEAAAGGADAVRAAAHEVLREATQRWADVRPDYLALVDPASFEEVPDGWSGEAVLATAVRVGATRLIDNATITLEPR